MHNNMTELLVIVIIIMINRIEYLLAFNIMIMDLIIMIVSNVNVESCECGRFIIKAAVFIIIMFESPEDLN